MAVVQRYNGDAKGVTNVDNGLDANGARVDAGAIINTGIASPITAYKITAGATLAGEMGVEGAVEIILRTVAQRASILAYQVTATQLAVVVERSGWVDDAALEDAIQALGATVGAGPVNLTTTTVDSTGGLELA